MRLAPLILALLVWPAMSHAQRPRASVDSSLVRRILDAEDRRDASDASLAEGLQHDDARIRTIAWRARARITDSLFASRDSLPPAAAPVVWPEPAWRLRFRALASQRADCHALESALSDSAWAVRLRAADLAGAPCAFDSALLDTLRRWIDALPSNASRRTHDGVAWQAAAHALVTLARVAPGDARQRLPSVARNGQWQLRMYAARAAALLGDTARLRSLAADVNGNVRDAAITPLAKLTGRADDEIFIKSLRSGDAPAVRAAALALAGSPRTDVRPAADSAFERWVARDDASAHDVRAALLAAAGRPASDDRPPTTRAGLAPDAVALALGADRRLRVTMSPLSGGGVFTVRLRGDVAPIMAARILDLARRGYYNGLTWHRVESDFVIQGGSPGASEYVGWTRSLRDELGTVPHVRGTVGMSTRGHDSGDAQWFVNLRDNQRLDRDYTLFADVIDGMNVVDGILEGDTIASIIVLPPDRPGQRDR